jgi:hypothetical protein
MTTHIPTEIFQEIASYLHHKKHVDELRLINVCAAMIFYPHVDRWMKPSSSSQTLPMRITFDGYYRSVRRMDLTGYVERIESMTTLTHVIIGNVMPALPPMVLSTIEYLVVNSLDCLGDITFPSLKKFASSGRCSKDDLIGFLSRHESITHLYIKESWHKDMLDATKNVEVLHIEDAGRIDFLPTKLRILSAKYLMEPHYVNTNLTTFIGSLLEYSQELLPNLTAIISPMTSRFIFMNGKVRTVSAYIYHQPSPNAVFYSSRLDCLHRNVDGRLQIIRGKDREWWMLGKEYQDVKTILNLP